MGKTILPIVIAFVFVGIFLYLYERSKVSVKEIPIIVVLASLAALGRIPFVVIPGVQPTTVIVILSGFVLGPLSGFMVGAVAAMVSNMFLGQGPWTIWQMTAWSLCGILAGVLGKIFPKAGIKLLGPVAFLCGFLFGWIMNLWYWMAFIYPLTLETWIGVNITSFWFDFLHAFGNVVFMVVFGASFLKILKHFKNKLIVSYH